MPRIVAIKIHHYNIMEVKDRFILLYVEDYFI